MDIVHTLEIKYELSVFSPYSLPAKDIVELEVGIVQDLLVSGKGGNFVSASISISGTERKREGRQMGVERAEQGEWNKTVWLGRAGRAQKTAAELENRGDKDVLVHR
jgi:hypothetical protein